MNSPVGEDEIVEAIRRVVESGTHPRRIVLGIGDDAAVWQPSRSHRSVITTDALIENVHFSPETMELADIGWRAMVANLSDVAAMGARPVLATIALGVADPGPIDAIVDLYSGMQSAAQGAGCAIVGGDITRSPVLMLSITVVGEVRPSNLKTRSGAQPKDMVAVSGALGASRAGLDVARGAVDLEEPLRSEALLAHRRPKPRTREGPWLAASRHVHAMMDLSDGLSTDLSRLCERSHLGAVLEAIPIAPCAAAAAQTLGVDPIDYALAGGEEYELLSAIDANAFAHLARRFYSQFGRELHGIGVFTAEQGLFLRDPAGERPLVPTGWDAFKSCG